MWSCGLLLWTIATRELPYGHLSRAACIRAVKAGSRPPPLAGAPHARGVPAEWQRLVDACLAQEAEERPEMRAVLRALEEMTRVAAHAELNHSAATADERARAAGGGLLSDGGGVI